MSDNNIAQDLADTFTFKKQRQAISDTVDKAKRLFGMNTPSAGTDNPDQNSYAAQQKAKDLKRANDSFKPKTPPATKTPVPKYKEGTDYVPKTGPAILHKGEAVLKKEDADKHREAKGMSHKSYDVSEELGGKKEEKPKKEIKHITTKKAKNGGYIHEHHHTHPEHHPMEEHVSPDQDAMVSHMMDHMGEQNPGEADADAGQSGVPQQAAPAQAAPTPQPMGM